MPTPEEQKSFDLLREEVASQLTTLEHLRESGKNLTGFKVCPFEPNATTIHEATNTRHPLGCYQLRDMILIGAHALFANFERQILREQNADTKIEESISVVSATALLDTIPTLDSAVSLVSAPSYNFYHWTIDSLPKVLVAEACGFQGMYILPPTVMNKRASESLALLGIPKERMLPMEFPFIVVDTLWIPTHFHGVRMDDTPILHRMFRERMLEAASAISVPAQERLYVRRNPALKIRTIVNGEEVEALLKSFGFEVFGMEHLTVREQLALASKARVLLGPHGAGMLHSLWMSPGGTVIELHPYNYNNRCMEVHSRLVGHRYIPWMVKNSTEDMQLTIDCDELRKTLQETL